MNEIVECEQEGEREERGREASGRQVVGCQESVEWNGGIELWNGVLE